MTTTTAAPAVRPNKLLHAALWGLQGLLAAAFLFGGGMKLLAPIDQLATQMAWVKDLGAWSARVPGFFEVLGALGLVLPAASRIKPWLTPLAAAGLVTIMVLAAALHLSRGEPIVPNLVLGGVAAIIAWGRFKLAPIAAR